MNSGAFQAAVSSLLEWDAPRAGHHPPEQVRIAMSLALGGDVAIDRLCDGVYRVTTGRDETVYRSRKTSDLDEAVELFTAALLAARVGYNIGSAQDEFENRFDPPASSDSPVETGVRQALRRTADLYDREAMRYQEMAAEMRQEAGNQ